jgi:hypothetical protein
MASKNVGRLHPDRRVFVARDVEDEEAVGFCFMGGERRIAPANLLSDRLAQVADDHEMARLVKIMSLPACGTRRPNCPRRDGPPP